MCFRQGKACVYASEEDGRIIITEPPDGVVERVDTRTGQITGAVPTAVSANGTGQNAISPKVKTSSRIQDRPTGPASLGSGP